LEDEQRSSAGAELRASSFLGASGVGPASGQADIWATDIWATDVSI